MMLQTPFGTGGSYFLAVIIWSVVPSLFEAFFGRFFDVDVSEKKHSVLSLVFSLVICELEKL